MVGGSGLYIDAICKGFDKMPETPTEIREKVIELYKTNGLEFLQNEVEKKDPLFYKEVDKNNPQRLLRALEVMYDTNKTFSSFRKKEDKKRNFNIIKIGLESDRELLYNRINSRVDRMMKNGLLKEVESLINFKNKNSLQTVGYKEIFEYLEGESSIDEAISKIKQNSRRFAKRQITWFKKDTSIKYFCPKSLEEIIKFIG
jgi:tRNA dimethylallyltransferase